MSAPRLGRVQLVIMQILWDRGSATAREITEAINHKEPCAHSTVQTLLRGLEEKGAVRHEAQDRTFVFHPLVKEQEFKRSATRDVLERVFGGSVSGLVAHLLKEENVSREEIEEIRKLINRRIKKESRSGFPA
jgi:BlaI family penicillinase repressor